MITRHLSSSRNRWYGTVVVGLAAAACGLLFAHALGTHTTEARAEGVTIATLSADSSPADIIEFTQGPPRWRSIEAQGRICVDGQCQDFDLAADRVAGEYRSTEGDVVVGRDAAGQYTYDRTAGKLHASAEVPAQSAALAADMQKRMAEAVALDPTLARSGELLIATPLNDLVNPSYFVRRELGVAAQSVTKAGLASVAGRQAVHLVVTFPRGLAKEDHWDVYVDVQTGIVLGLVVAPLPENPRYEIWIDRLVIDPVISSSSLDRSSL